MRRGGVEKRICYPCFYGKTRILPPTAESKLGCFTASYTGGRDGNGTRPFVMELEQCNE